ncbi:radial spoke head protein 3 [Histomonas meleagridis]|uniref:radial spoke head protein 3-like n=1 Tax=Histomonas meleagridis TaxID=135588 RepID=UPI003559A4DB|nr:radial spoke head protein 3 [Histomonas meleagridis]KAH0802931.1 radial spoke head protein 3-like [Histomonas meleagridis]
MTNTYAFRASARPVFSQNKYKEENEEERTAVHISVDPRVARGSVYSHHKPPTSAVKPIRYKPKPIPRPKETHEITDDNESLSSEILPELVEISDRPIEDDLATAQETYIERPPTPQFIESEPGVDVGTQVEEKYVFNFDAEVRPIVKVIVQNTLLRALAEVHEESEIENISSHRDRFEVERNTILAELQRLEAKSQRKLDEQKRRIDQRQNVQREIKEMNKKFSLRGFSSEFATDVMQNAFNLLEQRGYFVDEVEQEVEQVFLPWLASELSSVLYAKETENAIQKEIVKKVIDIDRKLRKETEKVEMKKPLKEEKRKKKILRKMFVEDLTAGKIRERKRAAKERKKKEVENQSEYEYESEML